MFWSPKENQMKIMLCKLGSEDKGFIPSKKMFDQFKVALQDAIDKKGDVGSVLLTHPFARFKEVEIPDGAKVVCVNDVMDEATIFDEKVSAIEKRMLKQTRECIEDTLRASAAAKPWYKRMFARLAK